MQSPEAALLAKERADASFNPRDMTVLLMGGRDKIKRLEDLREAFTKVFCRSRSHIKQDPVFSKRDRIFSNHKEAYKRSLEKMAHFHTKVICYSFL